MSTPTTLVTVTQAYRDHAVAERDALVIRIRAMMPTVQDMDAAQATWLNSLRAEKRAMDQAIMNMVTERPQPTWDYRAEPVHYSTGAGTVRCGRHMSTDPLTDPGFDMGTSSVKRTEVTCPHCLSNTRWGN
jgi:hypothetical protein